MAVLKNLAFLLTGTFSAAAALAAPASHDFLELAVSPDGRFVASVEGDRLPTGGRPVVQQLLIRSVDGKAETTVKLPCGAVPQCWPGSPAWTPDGKRLSFALRTPGSHARSIYQVGADGRGLKKLLSFDGTVQDLRYAANGTLAMLATAAANKEVGATEAGAPVEGDLDAAPPEQRLAVLAPGAKELRWVSRPDYFVYQYDWMPDGSGLVATAAPGDGDRNWWVAKLYAFGIDGAKPERLIYAPQNVREQLASPKVSPDGHHVALIVGLMSDFQSFGGDVFIVHTSGGGKGNGKATNITPQARFTTRDLHWNCKGHLIAQTLAGDKTQALDLGDPHAPQAGQLLWESRDEVRDLSVGACATPMQASVHQNHLAAPEIQISQAGPWRDLTRRNAALKNKDYRVQSLSWTNDGFTIQGWLLMPTAKSAAAKLPLIVDVHGGPAGASQARFISGNVRMLLDHGYALLLPNPRGSFGQGEAFAQANAQDFGGGDLRDILAGVDAAAKNPEIDGERVGITGHSYGGFMTMWAVTQTDRFKAAVAGAGLANWQSYYGQNGISEWMIPFFGASVYDDPAVYAKSSPINFIKRVKTPTFSYVGANDIECPPAQTQEFGRALQILGVPSSTVIYAGEGHGFRKPSTYADIDKRTLAWFDKYLKQ